VTHAFLKYFSFLFPNLVILMLLLQFRGPIVIGVEAATMGNAFRFSDLLPVAQSCAGQLNGDAYVHPLKAPTHHGFMR